MVGPALGRMGNLERITDRSPIGRIVGCLSPNVGSADYGVSKQIHSYRTQ